MTDTIKIIEENTKVEVTPAPTQMPKRAFPTTQFVKELKAEKANLLIQINDVDAKLNAIKDAGVDISKIE